MKTKSRKIYLTTLICAILTLIAAVCLTFFVGVDTSFAEDGYTAYPPNKEDGFHLSLTLDVNGADATTDPEDTVEKIDSANENSYRKRAIDIGAILAAYAKKEASGSNAYSPTNYGLLSSSTLYNSFSEYVAVEKSGQSGNRFSRIIIEAKKYKKAPNQAYIAIPFTRQVSNPDIPANITVYINITINSTFAPLETGAVTASQNIYLEEDINANTDGTGVAGYSPLYLENNTTVRFELAGRNGIVGKTLCKDSSGSIADLKNTAKVLTETVDKSKNWVINDLSNFVIESVAVGDVISGSGDIKVIGGQDGVTDPVMTISVSFKENILSAYPDFWTDPHYLTFTLRARDGKAGAITFGKRVYFTTGRPSYKTDFDGMPRKLNFSSGHQYVGQIDNQPSYTDKGSTSDTGFKFVDTGIWAAGFSQVRVFASNLVDYPTQGKLEFNPQFNASDVTVSPSGVVSVNISSDFSYYTISADGVGSAVVHFPIRYAAVNGAAPSTMTVPVVFSVYGQYTLTQEQISGRKDKTFSTLTDKFKQLADDDFYINSAKISDGGEAILQVSLASNSIIIHPLQTGDVVLKLGFMDLQGNQIFLDWAVQIDYESGTIFATWTTIQLVLFFIGIGIVVLALVLFLVWLFIRGISKRRQEENETSAPTSAYIIKLNSTIAASQAQQRIVTTQAFNTAQTQMLALGAGSTSTGVTPSDALQLSAGIPNTSVGVTDPKTVALGSGVGNTTQQSTGEDIYIPLSDDELLERIFVEKYEPRGMARRSFFKSKDLQTRELEKEKARIRDDVRSGMTIEEASKSLSERQAMQANSAVTADAETKVEEVPEDSIVVVLGFDPDSPLLEEPAPAPIEDADAMTEEVALKNSELRLERIEKELAVIQERLNKTQAEIDKAKAAVEETDGTLNMKEESNAALRKSVEDLEFKLATAKNKEKEKINKDIENKEHVIESNKEIITKLTEELARKRSNLDTLSGIYANYDSMNAKSEEEHKKLLAEVEEARENYRIAQELMEKARKAQEIKEKRSRLRPMLESINALDAEIRGMENTIEKDSKEKDTIKAEASELQKQMLGTNDIEAVKNITERLSVLNKQVSDLDKKIAAANKSKADKNIQFNGDRRKTNEFIDKEELEVEDVVAEEDDVIGKMAFDEYMRSAHEERENAEKLVSELQASYEELVAGYDAEVMNMAVKATESVKAAEDALAETQAAIDALNEQMETASDDDKLMLSIDQMSLNEQLEQNKKALDELQASAAKEKVEYQMQYDNKLEETKHKIEEAQAAYDEASRKVDDSMNKINPLDLILSGSGVISQDRKRMEAENLKKQLELSKSAMEQAKLQAKQAQMDAEKAIIDAQRASDESKAEAERQAQEAIAKAEEARLAAEQKAAEDSEQLRLEVERAKQEAEDAKIKAAEEAERARREAEEQAEQARKKAEEDAEQARKEAEEQAEQARKEAEEQAEKARKEAEEQAEKARKEAEEQAEKARKEAEEQAEQARKEAEDEKRRLEEEKKRTEEENEKARKEAEEQAEKDKAVKEAEEKRIREKIEKKKAHILEMRSELKTVTDEASAKALKEKFYNEQVKLDEDEKSTPELHDLLNKCMDDADHAAEVSMYKALANKAPKRVVKKVTERVNKIPKRRPGTARPGARPARPGARPVRPGARPVRPGARPSRPGAARPGARPTRPGGAPRPKK